MNELNLQNPDFRRRIDYVEINEKNIVVELSVRGLYFDYGYRIFSNDKLLSNNQRWFSDLGEEIKTLHQLDEKVNPIFRQRIN